MATPKIAVVYTIGAPASGDYAGVYERGQLLVDQTTGEVYINKGTISSPNWTKIS